MKKIYFLLFNIAISAGSMAQTVTSGDMENWRTSHTGFPIPSVTINAPVSWICSDSLVIALGQAYGLTAGIPASAWKRQVFQESGAANVHGGTSSAKLMTRHQDTLGNFPCYLTNSKFNLPINLTTSPPTVGTPTYNGGQAVTQRINSVSAWVKYLPGIDSMTGLMGGIDTGMLTVQARGHLTGADTTVAMTVVKILPSASFMQITANLTYFDTTYTIDTIRMVFASSGGGITRPLDSSTLYVDDITMVGAPGTDHSAVRGVTAKNIVTVYPNPSQGYVYIDAGTVTGLSCELYEAGGKLLFAKPVGNDKIDISYLPNGLYFYIVRDSGGQAMQRGEITLTK